MVRGPFSKTALAPFGFEARKLTRQFFVSGMLHIDSYTRKSHGLPMAEYQAYFIRRILKLSANCHGIRSGKRHEN
jgi:hypothetical protein